MKYRAAVVFSHEPSQRARRERSMGKAYTCALAMLLALGASFAPAGGLGFIDHIHESLEQTRDTSAPVVVTFEHESRAPSVLLEELVELDDLEDDDDNTQHGLHAAFAASEECSGDRDLSIRGSSTPFRLHAFSSRAPPLA